jgi:6-phosphogluconolactonase/glucosamine-6-phosphate isomerase/deaminase
MTKLHTFHTLEELGAATVKRIVDISKEAISKYDHFWLVLSGGSVLNLLAKHLPLNSEEYVKWRIAFADERIVPFDDQDSNAGQAYRLVLRDRGIQIHQIYSLFSPKADKEHESHMSAEEAAKRYDFIIHQAYEKTSLETNHDRPLLLKKYPAFDCVILGMGPDGHVASFFPGHSTYLASLQTNHLTASLRSSVYSNNSDLDRITEHDTSSHDDLELDTSEYTSHRYSTPWVVSVSGAPKPPPNRISLSLDVLTHARQVLFVVHGQEKAPAVRKVFLATLDRPKWLDHEWISNVPPGAATHFLTNGTAIWLVDEEAASQSKSVAPI